jgi:N-acetylmuramoyl-L-alanine amidase
MKREIRYIVIHTTATPQSTTVASIQRHWKDTLKWTSPGYHRLIEPNGTVHKLENYDNPTNGVKGHNRNSIHISYIGGVDTSNRPIDNRTPQQKEAIIDCIVEALGYAQKKVFIQGHRDFEGVAKACPCFDAIAEYRFLQ